MLLSALSLYLNEDELKSLSQDTRLKTLKKNEPLWRMGEKVEHFGVVLKGVLGASVDMGGDSESLAGVFCKQDVLLTSLLEGALAPMTIKALSSVDLAWVPLRSLTPIAKQNWALTAQAYQMSVERLARQRYMSAVLINAPIERRLAHAYWQLSSLNREGLRVVETKISQADIGKLIGSSREEVSRRTALLEQSGYLSVVGGLIHLSDSMPLLILSETEVPPFFTAELGLG